MPTPSEISVETKGSSEIIQNDKSSIESHLEAQDMQQKKKQLNQSPRRKNNTNRPFNMQSNRRHSGGFHKKNNDNNVNNKQPVYKQLNQQQQQQQQHKTQQNLNPMSNNQHQDSNKKSQKTGYRTIFKNHNGNMHFDLIADNNTVTTNLDNDYLNRQQSPGDSNDVPRKYSKSFLNEVGYKLTSSKQMDEQTALRMALGDNSRYFGHFFSGQLLHGNQMILQHQQTQQQQQQPYYQSLPRFHTQHLPLQRLQRNSQSSYNKSPSVYEQQELQSLPCHCPQAQQQIPQQRSMQYSSYQNSPTYHNHNKRDNFRSGDKNKRQYGYHNNNSNNNNNNYRGYIEKSQSFNEEDLKSKNYHHQLSLNENQAFRSLSPTPPNSSKSSSPGVHEKCNEVIDDSASTASGASSVQGYFEGAKSPSENISSSAPLLTVPDFPAKRTNTWIDAQKFDNKLSYNGYSLSADEIHNFSRENYEFKRPQSVNGNKNFQILKHSPSPDSFEMHMQHAEDSEIRVIPPSLLSRSKFDSLSEQMWKKFQSNQQSKKTHIEKINIWRDLNKSLKNFHLFHQLAYPKWGLFMVGSTISGFGSDRSDVDMCFVIKGPDSRSDPRNEAIMTLHDLKNHLTSTRSPFTNYTLINAKVPILRFHHPTNKIEVDLNYNNCVGVRNTHLLCHYSQLDWRIRPLALVVKLWAQFHNINDARNSTISSYSLVLMVIHFLQYAVKPAILPCLHKLMPEKFNHLHDITTINMVEHCDINWQSDNTQSLGELFLRFLDYYTNFDYSKHAISIRTGGLLNIEDCKMVKNPKNDPNHWQTLCIEEPFDRTNTARSAYDAEIFKKIREVFQYSFLKLNEDRKLESVFTEQLFTQQEQQQMHHLKYLTMNGHGPAMLLSNDVKS